MIPSFWQQIFGRAAQALVLSEAAPVDGLRAALRACLPALGDFGWFDLRCGGGVQRLLAAHDAPQLEALLAGTAWSPTPPPWQACALSCGHEVMRDCLSPAELGALTGTDTRALGRSPRSVLSVPLWVDGQVAGALTLFMAGSNRRHGPQHLERARSLAALVTPHAVQAGLFGAPAPTDAERIALQAAERRAHDAADAAARRLEVLASAGEALSASLDTQATLHAIAGAIVPAIADWCRIDLMDERGSLRRAMAWHVDPECMRRAAELVGQEQPAQSTEGSMPWVAATGRSLHGRLPSPASDADPATRRWVEGLGLCYFFCLPLVARGRTIGVMAVVQAESGRELDEQDRALVRQLAGQTALALDNARLYGQAGAAREQAEQANRAKDEFLAMLGHELRNPLAPIATALELMDRRAPEALLAERRIIGRQVAHLSRLIEDLLDVSRIARGKIQLRRERVDLRRVVARALELTGPVFEQRLPVAVDLPAAAVWVDGDAVRLAQVLSNLLVNAAKFTPPAGLVSLRLALVNEQARLEVVDAGCGIGPDLLPRVFDLFVQGHQSIDRQAGGLGLGLSIVRSLVELHGGAVEVSSAGAGQGSCFVVQLPVCAAAPAPQPALDAPAPSGEGGQALRILVVDDNADAAQMLSELLCVLGHEARTAGDAHAALGLLAEFRPQLALLDIGLPRIDGYQLARLIRQEPAGHRLPLIAVTGYGSPQDRARALAAGFNEHLAKPVAIERLLAVIEEVAGELGAPVLPPDAHVPAGAAACTLH